MVSQPTRKLTIAPEASEDLRNISSWSHQYWLGQIATEYMERLWVSFERIPMFPSLAPPIEFADDERHFPVGSHVVV
jgi:hypothetical protein